MKTNNKYSLAAYLSALIAIVILWWFYPPLVNLLESDSYDLDSTVERLDTLFSALAFAGLIITLYYQRRDFVDSRKYSNINEFI